MLELLAAAKLSVAAQRVHAIEELQLIEVRNRLHFFNARHVMQHSDVVFAEACQHATRADVEFLVRLRQCETKTTKCVAHVLVAGEPRVGPRRADEIVRALA